MLICVVAAFFIRVQGDDSAAWKNTINSDGRGYFAYLASLAKDHDLSFSYVQKTLSTEQSRAFLIPLENDRLMDKYFPGTALLIAPFFAVLSFVDWMMNGQVNPYGWAGQFSVLLAALFYLGVGLHYARKLLVLLFPVAHWSVALIIPVLVFGSSLFHYAVVQPAMSHVYSFCVVTAFIYYALLFLKRHDGKHLILASLFLGLAVIIRPVNAIIILSLPGLWMLDGQKFRPGQLLNHKKHLVAATLIIAGLMGLTLVVFRMQTGAWFTWSYKGEGFYFLDPKFFQVVLGFRRGLLVYTPVLLLMIPGMVLVFQSKRKAFYYLLAFYCAHIYLVSSWWSWYYGDGFGHRAFIDFYIVWFIPIAFLLVKVTGLWRILTVTILTIFTTLTAFQNYQYRIGILHPFDMDFQKYAAIFLRSGDEYKGVIRGNKDVQLFGQLIETPLFNFNSEPNKQYETAGNEFPMGTEVIPSTQFYGNKLFFDVRLKYSEPLQGAANELLLVTDMQDATGNSIDYRAIPVKGIAISFDNEPTVSTMQYNYDGIPAETKLIKIYLWNKDEKAINLLVFSVKIHEISP